MCLPWKKEEEGERVREFKENEKGRQEERSQVNPIKPYGAKAVLRFFLTTENKILRAGNYISRLG